MNFSIPPARYIDTQADFDALMVSLADETLLAVDTESNNMYAYEGRVCLIQLSTRTHDYIVDPLAVSDITAFGELLNNPAIEKIFHAAEYDLICLKRDYGFGLNNLFDTMYAVSVLGHDSIGLAALLEDHFGVISDKKHQLDDWGARPLAADSLRYAQMDTHFLPELRDILYKRLDAANRLQEAFEVFEDVTHITLPDASFDPDGFWQLVRPSSLQPQEAAILRELYLLRETIAQEWDRPPFKVLSNKALLALAHRAPARKSDLFHMKHVPPEQARRLGSRIIQAIRQGQTQQPPEPPPAPEIDPELSDRYVALHTWRKHRARSRDVESHIVISKQILWELARRVPTKLDDLREIPGIGPWRLEQYGPEIIDVMRDFHNGSSG